MSFFKKNIFIFLVIAQFFPLHAVFAISLDSVSSSLQPSKIIQDIEKRYHLDRGALQNVGEGLNVASQKSTAPEVTLFFSPNNPIPGQEITAEASPSYFNNNKEDLYFTWYIKHKDCDTDSSVRDEDPNKFCDTDDDNDIDVEDWKIEASRILANNGFDFTKESYANDTDSDSYSASLGGNGSKNIPNRCYIQDFSSGTLYEFSGGSWSTTFGCAPGTIAQCTQDNVTLSCSVPGPLPEDPPVLTNYLVCQNTGITPTCSDSEASCATGTARCIPFGFTNPACSDLNLQNTSCSSIGTAISSCSIDSSQITNACEHLFPNAPGDTTGDGEFGASEERFWRTNPNDPDTAGTSYGDEANVAGLGQSKFTWVYEVGDKIGVAVEGTSIIPTKHDDRSYMVMWALPKNDCPLENSSSYRKTIRGYDVTFPTTATDINNCLEKNLVDPREGGQVGKIKASLTYSPKTPFNDSSGDAFGTPLALLASTEDTEAQNDILHYEWNVFVSGDGSFNPSGYSADPQRDATGAWINITEFLKENQLASFTEGNGLNNLTVKLNLTNALLEKSTDAKIKKLKIENLFPDGLGHLKVTTKVTEYNDTNKKAREDTATVIIPIISTDLSILSRKITIDPNTKKLKLGTSVCNEKQNSTLDTKHPENYNPLGLGRNLCLVSKNEIMGLTINNTHDLSNFQWMVNGDPLTCTDTISDLCSKDKETAVNFLPIIKDPGEQYEVSVTAINVQTGKKVTLSKTFAVITPMIKIRSANMDVSWPKYLGYYKGTDGYAYAHLSENQFQAYSGSTPEFSLEFIPSWVSKKKWQWYVNGNPFGENIPSLKVLLEGAPGRIYSLSAEATSIEDEQVRKALTDFWGYSVFDSTENHMSHAIEIQTVVNEEEELSLSSPRAFFANIAKNAQQQVFFIIQIFLSLGTLVILMSVLFSLSTNKKEE